MGDSLGTTSQENPFQGMSFVSPPCEDVGPPFMATLNLPGLTIGLPIWLFSIMVIPNASIALDLNSLLREHQHCVDTSPYFPHGSYPLSPSSLVESRNTTNQVIKEKKRKIKKKKGKLLTKSQRTTLPGESVEIPTETTRKPKLP